MINPNEDNIAEGDVVFDNGEIDVVTNGLYAHVKKLITVIAVYISQGKI